MRATTRLFQAQALATGLISQPELEAAYDLYDDPDFVDYTWLTIAAWGRNGGDRDAAYLADQIASQATGSSLRC